jgi:hypothetical protein
LTNPLNSPPQTLKRQKENSSLKRQPNELLKNSNVNSKL